MSLSEHAIRNRDAWTRMSASFQEPGRRAWRTPDIHWGIWNLPETQVGALAGIELAGKDVIELGCGTAYFSAWMNRLGAKPVGIDVTPVQLAAARGFQHEFGIQFPLLECSAEEVPLPAKSFDLAISEYGASIWCDPYAWIPEAVRLLRPGGRLVFLKNSALSMSCTPQEGPATAKLCRDWFGLHRFDWADDDSVEFHLNPSDMLRLLRKCGFEVEDLIYLRAPEGATTRYDYITSDWARRWPSEEIWRARLKG